MAELNAILEEWCRRRPMEAFYGLPMLSTVAEVSPAGVRFTYGGLADGDGEDPCENLSLPMGLARL
jgi:hypothetical protein